MEKFTKLIQGHEPVLIDFLSNKKYYPNCASVLDQVKNVLGERIRIITVDVSESIDMIAAHGFHLDQGNDSTLMLFRNGRILWREKGLLSGIEIIMNIVYNLK